MLLEEIRNFVAEIVRTELEKAIPKLAKPVPLLVDTATAASILALPESWIASAARRGDLPCVRLGAHVRFKISDLQKFLDEQALKKTG